MAGLLAEVQTKSRDVGGCRIVVIILPCQGRDGGSIPLTRSLRLKFKLNKI